MQHELFPKKDRVKTALTNVKFIICSKLECNSQIIISLLVFSAKICSLLWPWLGRNRAPLYMYHVNQFHVWQIVHIYDGNIHMSRDTILFLVYRIVSLDIWMFPSYMCTICHTWNWLTWYIYNGALFLPSHGHKSEHIFALNTNREIIIWELHSSLLQMINLTFVRAVFTRSFLGNNSCCIDPTTIA
jgi:hypothetical protein